MDDNTFECPHCGSVIYPEMTRCPQCGQDMYPPEDTTGSIEEEIEGSGWGKISAVVLIGWLVASGIATVIHFTIARFVTPPALPDLIKIFLSLAGPFGSLAGGYMSASLARQKAKLLGGLVGILSLPVSAILATHWVQVKLETLLNTWALAEAVLILLAGVCGGWLYEIYSMKDEWQEKWRVRGWEDLLYQDLLRKVRFNGSAADRLIEYERNLDPQASRLKLIQNAIERWERDNR